MLQTNKPQKMNIDKKAAQARIESLKSEMSELERIINAPDEPTYFNVMEKVAPRWMFYKDSGGAGQEHFVFPYSYADKQTAEREALRTKWLNIAAYVNDGWTPDWKDKITFKFVVFYDNENKSFNVDMFSCYQYCVIVFFKSEDAAHEAIRIMGESDLKKMMGIE